MKKNICTCEQEPFIQKQAQLGTMISELLRRFWTAIQTLSCMNNKRNWIFTSDKERLLEREEESVRLKKMMAISTLEKLMRHDLIIKKF